MTYKMQDTTAILSEIFPKKLNHRPLIDINPKNSKELKKKIQLIKMKKRNLKF